VNAPDHLAMLLTYAGAVDTPHVAAMEEVASDIVQVPFWTPEFCAAVVRAAELVGFEPDPDDPGPGHELSLATISPVLFGAVQHDIGVRICRSYKTCGR